MTEGNAETLLRVADAAKRIGVSVATMHTLCRREPGVRRVLLPGRKKPIVRVPLSVVERIIRRSTVT